MDEISKVIDWIFGIGGHYPVLIVLLGGTLVGFALTVALERYFLPVALSDQARRRQQGLTFLFCWFASGTASALLWWAIDGDETRTLRPVVSYLSGVLVFFASPAIVRYLEAKYPAIGSAWSKQ